MLWRVRIRFPLVPQNRGQSGRARSGRGLSGRLGFGGGECKGMRCLDDHVLEERSARHPRINRGAANRSGDESYHDFVVRLSCRGTEDGRVLALSDEREEVQGKVETGPAPGVALVFDSPSSRKRCASTSACSGSAAKRQQPLPFSPESATIAGQG